MQYDDRIRRSLVVHAAVPYLGDDVEAPLKLQYDVAVYLQSGVLAAHLGYATEYVTLVSVDVLTARLICA